MAENPRIEELRRRVQADPASIAFAALAEEFRRVGRYEDAIETCRTGLQRHPAYLSARVTLGRALIETGEYDAAREELQTVLRSAPENIVALRALAQINERLGHSTEMHPDLAAMAREPIKLAKPAPPPRAPEPPPLRPAPPIDFGAFDLPLSAPAPAAAAEASSAEAEAETKEEPFDIFAAALRNMPAPVESPSLDPARSPGSAFAPFEPELAAIDFDPAPPAAEPPPLTFEAPPLTFDPDLVVFDAPDTAAGPDPDVAAALMRLERFLGAIHTARHA